MTQFGFLATNNNSQVLISSKTKNLHFLGKAAFYSTVQSTDNWGGIRRWAFRIKCPTTPTPFFSTPTADRYAISRMTLVSADLWEIEIMRSGTSSTIPEVYIFCEINSLTRPTNSYGFQVFNEDGTGTTFDSRLRPLVVKGGIYTMPPYDPYYNTPTGLSAHFCESDAGSAFAPTRVSSSVAYNTNLTKPIVSYQSISQTEREVRFNDSNSKRHWITLGFTVTYEFWVSMYWAFYRAAVSVQQSGAHSYINTGWVAIEYGCLKGYQEKDTINVPIFNVDVLDYDSDSSQGGKIPLSNQTINLYNVPVVLADGAMYD